MFMINTLSRLDQNVASADHMRWHSWNSMELSNLCSISLAMSCKSHSGNLIHRQNSFFSVRIYQNGEAAENFGWIWLLGLLMAFYSFWSVGIGRSSQICAAAIYDSLVMGGCLRIERYIATGCSQRAQRAVFCTIDILGPVCVVVSGHSAPVSLAVLVYMLNRWAAMELKAQIVVVWLCLLFSPNGTGIPGENS